MNYHFKLGLLMACLLFLFSCQKEEILDQPPTVEDTATLESIVGNDPLLDKFFNGIADHDTIVDISNKAKVDKIKLAMAKDHLERPFVRDYARQVGFPLWGQAKIHHQGGGRHLYALPFAKSNSTFTTAVLHIAVDQEELLYELALRTDITDYLPAYDNGTNTFYWENLLGFIANFIIYDDVIFGFKDNQFSDWFDQNEESYLTDAADTRSCIDFIIPYCKAHIALQEIGSERECNGTQYYVIVEFCIEGNDQGSSGPHQPGGQTGGVPSIGGGGGSSSPINNTETGSGPGENPGIDPGTWGDEGSNEPGNLQMILFDDFLNQLEQQGQLNWFNHPQQDYLKTAIISKIFSDTPDFSILPNAHILVDIMEGYDVIFDEEVIDYLLLSTNNQALSEIKYFLVNRTDLLIQAREEASEIYAHLLATDIDFSSYIAEDHPNIPGWMWPLLREIGIEVASQLAKKYGPAGTVNEVVDAVRNLGQGEVLDFLGNILDILRKKVPALAAVSLTLDGIDLGGKAAKAWKAIAKLEQFGDEVIGKFLTTIKNHSNGLLGKLKWKGGNTGIELLDVVNPNDFWNNFKNLFPDITGPYINPTQPLEQTYRVLDGTIEIKFYPSSNTTGGFTLSFRVRPGGTPIKIRFL